MFKSLRRHQCLVGTSKTLRTKGKLLKGVAMTKAGCPGIPVILFNSQRGPETEVSALFMDEGSQGPQGLEEP